MFTLAYFSQLTIDLKESLDALYKRRINNYSLGWKNTRVRWANGYAMHHSGTNKYFTAEIWIAPRRNFAAVAATNMGGDDGKEACVEAITELVSHYVLKE